MRRSPTALFIGPAEDQDIRAGDLLVVLGSAAEIDRTAALLR